TEEQPFMPKVPEWMDIDLVPYGFAKDSVNEQRPQESSPMLQEEPLGMEPINSEVARQEAESRRQAQPSVPEYEMKLAERGHQEPVPEFPLWSGIYTFPWYRSTLHPLIALAAGLFVVMVLLTRLMAT